MFAFYWDVSVIGIAPIWYTYGMVLVRYCCGIRTALLWNRAGGGMLLVLFVRYGIGVVLVWYWNGIGMVSVWHWYGIGMVLVWHWYGAGVVLEWRRYAIGIAFGLA